jgi:hypothetical protein
MAESFYALTPPAGEALRDTFTGSAGTLLTAHAGESLAWTGDSGLVLDGAGNVGLPSASIATCVTTATHTAEADVEVTGTFPASTVGDAGISLARVYFRYGNPDGWGLNWVRAEVRLSNTGNWLVQLWAQRFTGPGTSISASVPGEITAMGNGVPFTLFVSLRGTTVTAQLQGGGVMSTATLTDTAVPTTSGQLALELSRAVSGATLTVNSVTVSQPVATGRDLRTRARILGTGAGAVAQEPRLIRVPSEAVLSYRGMAASWRITGSSSPQGLLTVRNTSATVLVRVRSFMVTMDATATLANPAIMFQLGFYTGLTSPSGGTLLTPVPFDTTQTSVAADVRCSGTADGVVSNLAWGAAASSAIVRQREVQRITSTTSTGAQQRFLPIELVDDSPNFVLTQNQALLLGANAVVAGDNVATNHYIVSVCWDEYTLP